MKRLESVDELKKWTDEIRADMLVRENKARVIVHMGTCGIAAGAEAILDSFLKEIEAKRIDAIVSQSACIGLCNWEPVVTVIHPGNGHVIYKELVPEKVPRIVEQHLQGGKAVEERVMDETMPFFTLQVRRILANQDIDPMRIEEYIARDGYHGLAKALTEMSREEVIEEVSKSGLRGRGGAGFPCGRKWMAAYRVQDNVKYMICNADEGDPGAYMNRSVLEGNPHSVIEGMTVGGYAIGARQGFIYVRAEYPLAVETLNHAAAQARERGLLGKNILGTGFEFDIDIFLGAGAFVCGESTALTLSIEGKRGMPKTLPRPRTTEVGLLGKPTVLNNVETFSSIPLIILKGASWYKEVGTESSTGTKTFCLVGKVSNSGLVEVPLGIPMSQIVLDMGGGPPEGKKFKAVQIGGPSGGCIPREQLSVSVDYQSIPKLGAIMGSGGLVVMDEDTCMVDTARYFLQFTKEESCGQCIPCRVGIPRMLDILNKITEGKGSMEDLDTLEELGEMIVATSLCGLGNSAPNPVLTALRYFRDEFEAHIIDKKCPAAVCQALFRAPCQHVCPVELDVPGYIALIKEGKFEDAYNLIMQRLPFPSICGRICHHPCEAKCRRGQVDDPLAIKHLKRFVTDWALEHEVEYTPQLKGGKKEKIAIIGAGPAGLSAAYDLTREGYQVTVFESLPIAGGMVMVGVPRYRLAKESIEKEIEAIKKMGVEIKLNSKIEDINALFDQGYNAVFIATGAHKGLRLNIPGEDLDSVYQCVELLRRINLGEEVKLGKKVIVIGGGNVAMDAARSALRLGSEVKIVCLESSKEMPAWEWEIDETLEEGISIIHSRGPRRILSTDGKVSGLEVMEVRTVFDDEGRFNPTFYEDKISVIEGDTIILAIGQSPDTSFIKEGDGIELARHGWIVAGPRTLATKKKGVFAGGDVVTGPKSVVEAVAAGQRAACSIKRYLESEELAPRVEREDERTFEIPLLAEEVEEQSRVTVSNVDPSQRKSSFCEVTLGYTEEQAREEARRCLRCDLEV